MKLMAGNSNLPLARAIAAYLEIPLTDASVRRFADEEIFIEIHENVRGEDLFMLQSTSYPANDNLMELLIGIDACRRASAKRITAVHPVLRLRPAGPQARPAHADLGQAGRQPDHRGRRRPGALGRPPRRADPGLLRHPDRQPLRRADDGRRHPGRATAGEDLMVVSPDVGGVVRARALAKRLDNAPLAIVDKRRERPGESEVMNIIGDVKGRCCILADDIIDSGGTLCNAAQALMDAGAKSVAAYITHGVLSGGAVARVDNSALTELVITDIDPADRRDQAIRAASASSPSPR